MKVESMQKDLINAIIAYKRVTRMTDEKVFSVVGRRIVHVVGRKPEQFTKDGKSLNASEQDGYTSNLFSCKEIKYPGAQPVPEDLVVNPGVEYVVDNNPESIEFLSFKEAFRAWLRTFDYVRENTRFDQENILVGEHYYSLSDYKLTDETEKLAGPRYVSVSTERKYADLLYRGSRELPLVDPEVDVKIRKYFNVTESEVTGELTPTMFNEVQAVLYNAFKKDVNFTSNLSEATKPAILNDVLSHLDIGDGDEHAPMLWDDSLRFPVKLKHDFMLPGNGDIEKAEFKRRYAAELMSLIAHR